MSRILFETTLPDSAVVEFAAVCMHNYIAGSTIACKNFQLQVLKTDDGKIAFEPLQSAAALDLDDDLSEIVKLQLGLFLLEGEVTIEGGWRFKVAPRNFVIELMGDHKPLAVLNEPLNQETALTLADLVEIHDLLNAQPEPLSQLCDHQRFKIAFPNVNSGIGMYEHLRHRRGHEVFGRWAEDGSIESYRIDAPSPCESLFQAWNKKFGSKPKRKNVDFDDIADGGFQNSPENRWRIARILNEVPDSKKADAFAWVTKTIMAVEEFHSTRGGRSIPEEFEFWFDDKAIVANRKLEFTLLV